MEYRIVTTAQLSAHLRSLRKVRQLTQAQLGSRLGLGQARIGKIERNPAEVSFGQIMNVLAALGGRLVLVVPEHEASPTPTQGAPSTDDW
jgi:HTH-type transcriptional regulator/antitoxin HipB